MPVSLWFPPFQFLSGAFHALYLYKSEFFVLNSSCLETSVVVCCFSTSLWVHQPCRLLSFILMFRLHMRIFSDQPRLQQYWHIHPYPHVKKILLRLMKYMVSCLTVHFRKKKHNKKRVLEHLKTLVYWLIKTRPIIFQANKSNYLLSHSKCIICQLNSCTAIRKVSQWHANDNCF